MALDYKNNDAQRSLDKQQILDWQRGWQVINPANGDLLVTAGAGNFDYDIADGDVNAGGTTVSVSGESVDFTNDIDANDDQIAVIYIDSSGNAQKEIGPKGTRDPSGDDIRSTHTPAAPSMHSTNGVVLAEVLLPAGASSIGSTELRDRRLPAELILDTLTTEQADIADLGNDGSAISLSDVLDVAGELIRDTTQTTGSPAVTPAITFAAHQLADSGKAQLDPDEANPNGFYFVYLWNQARLGVFEIRGGNDDVSEVLDESSTFTTTEDNDTTVNVYFDSGNSRYELNNEIGGQRTFLVMGVKSE